MKHFLILSCTLALSACAIPSLEANLTADANAGTSDIGDDPLHIIKVAKEQKENLLTTKNSENRSDLLCYSLCQLHCRMFIFTM